MEFKYIKVPKEISYKECLENDYCYAPSKYSRFKPDKAVSFKSLEDLCTVSTEKEKIIKENKYIYSEIGDIDIYTGRISNTEYFGIETPSSNPKKIQNEDILISTVRTYRGGVGMYLNGEGKNVCSPAILVVRNVDKEISKEYLYAVLRTPFFIEQILGFQNRGMYPRLDKDAMKHILIPIPQNNEIINYVSLLVKAYLHKVHLIEKRHSVIISLIKEELSDNQKKQDFNYKFPTLNELEENNRLDATFYSKTHKRLAYPTVNYNGGYDSLDNQGLELKPGPSLEIRLLGTRIDSNSYLPGFYRLITPKQILNNGTPTHYEYIGTPREISAIEYGDILFGESGTGRSMVYLEEDKNTINNAHAHILRPIDKKCSLEKAITIRCILQYYKEIGLIDCLTVGGAGGHLSPSYFDRVYIPNFPESKQKEISNLYFADIDYDTSKCTIQNYLEVDEKFNKVAGIIELDKAMKGLKEKLNSIIDNIINDNDVDFDFSI